MSALLCVLTTILLIGSPAFPYDDSAAISGDQRSFLTAGGVGFIIGDGSLNYGPESILEAYYAFHATRSWTVTLDYQFIQNPAYNRDRGPVPVVSLRLHWER